MAQFADIPFDLEGSDDPFLPLMSLGTDGPPEITLPILLASRDDARALYAYRTRATARTALGQFAGVVVVHAGAGARTLLLPTGLDFALQPYSAILTELQWSRHEFAGNLYRASASFLILSDPLP